MYGALFILTESLPLQRRRKPPKEEEKEGKRENTL
jgi:hypothetical protein